MKYGLIIFALLLILSCNKTEQLSRDISACVRYGIDSALSKPKGSLFVKIDAYNYNGAKVYLYYAGCCDRYNELKDENCNYLFSPSGGFSGAGDGMHPNFFSDASFYATIWTDIRP